MLLLCDVLFLFSETDDLGKDRPIAIADAISHLYNLKYLMLENFKTPKEFFPKMFSKKSFNQLTQLELKRFRIPDGTFETIAAHCENLESLTITVRDRLDIKLEAISLLKKLKKLYLSVALCNNKEDIISLFGNNGNFEKMVELFLVNCVVDDTGIRSIVKACPNLESFHINRISKYPLRSENLTCGFGEISHLQKLKHLYIKSVFREPDEVLKKLFSAKIFENLTKLELIDLDIWSEDIEAISEVCPKLESITLNSQNTCDISIKPGSPIEKFEKLKNLRQLNLSGIFMKKDDVIAVFGKKILSELLHLSLDSDCFINNEVLLAIALCCTKLESFVLDYDENDRIYFDKRGIVHIIRFCKKLRKLQLNLSPAAHQIFTETSDGTNQDGGILDYEDFCSEIRTYLPRLCLESKKEHFHSEHF